MTQKIQHPGTRSCTRCGREERWDESGRVWRIRGEAVGERFCIHNWDITGEFNPVER